MASPLKSKAKTSPKTTCRRKLSVKQTLTKPKTLVRSSAKQKARARSISVIVSFPRIMLLQWERGDDGGGCCCCCCCERGGCIFWCQWRCSMLMAEDAVTSLHESVDDEEDAAVAAAAAPSASTAASRSTCRNQELTKKMLSRKTVVSKIGTMICQNAWNKRHSLARRASASRPSGGWERGWKGREG